MLDSVGSSVNLEGKHTPDLLKLAGVLPSDKVGWTWLSEAIDGARSSYPTAKQRPLAADHNALLTEIKKSAKDTTQRLNGFADTQPPGARSGALRPSVLFIVDRVEVRGVLSALEVLPVPLTCEGSAAEDGDVRSASSM